MTIDNATTTAWRPLFTGDEARRIDGIVSDVANLLRDPPDRWLLARPTGELTPARRRRLLSPLLGGWAGLSLLHGYRHLGSGDTSDRDAALALIERAVDALAEGSFRPDLGAGFTGIAWAVQHLQRAFGLTGEGDLAESADEALAELVMPRRPIRSYDLISGLAGWGVYCVERGPGSRAGECFVRIVDHLEALAERRDGRACWFTPPEAMPEHQRETAPEGYYNVGMAHGAAGVLAMLGLAQASGLADERIPGLVTAGARWILEQERPEDLSLRFVNWVARGRNERRSRFAWCYGDPGVIVGLVVAARGIGDAELCETMLVHARRAADLSIEHPDVRDAALCHGAAGVGHIFNRLFQATGEPCFADAARFHLRRAIELRAPGEDVAGFRALRAKPEGGDPWAADAGLLTGACGIALALHASTSHVVPAWDRVLLTAIP